MPERRHGCEAQTFACLNVRAWSSFRDNIIPFVQVQKSEHFKNEIMKEVDIVLGNIVDGDGGGDGDVTVNSDLASGNSQVSNGLHHSRNLNVLQMDKDRKLGSVSNANSSLALQYGTPTSASAGSQIPSDATAHPPLHSCC